MSFSIKVAKLSKQYRLGELGTGTFSHDLNRWWHKIRGKEDPYAKVGVENDRAVSSNSKYVWALKDINFELKPGDILGIVGKNGAGKSTLLKVLSRVTGPSSGEIMINGRIGSLLEVGTGMHPELTGKENIYLNGALLGMTKKEIASKLDEIIEFAGIAKYIDTPFKRYSSGMRVRLGFAVAAFLEPEILIVDEVLAVGDAEFQRKAIGKMKEVSGKAGRTVIFVSHNMSSINSLCTSCMYMKNGKIVNIGETEKIINQYLSSEIEGNVEKVFEDEKPGDEVARLKSVRLINAEKESIDYVEIEKKVGVELTFEIHENGWEPIPNIHLHTLKGDYVFIGAEKHDGAFSSKGLYTVIGWIPANFLNTESYSIDVGMSSMTPVKIHFLEKGIISFNAIENINLRRAGHTQAIAGIVRPLLDWEIKKMN